MKLKYYIVEYVSYVNDNGYPGLGTDINTMERLHFSSKKKAKRFVKRFMHSDPEYTRMWIAHITIQTVKIKVKMVKFPEEWANDAILKKQPANDTYKDTPISEKEIPLGKWEQCMLGVTEEYWKDTHLKTEKTDIITEKKNSDTFQA